MRYNFRQDVVKHKWNKQITLDGLLSFTGGREVSFAATKENPNFVSLS